MAKNRPRIKPRIHEWMASYSFIRERFVDGLWAYLDSVQSRLVSLREWWLSSPECSLRGVSKPQSATGDELSALLPSVLDKAFKGEL